MWQVYTLPGHSGSVRRLQFSDDGTQAISGSIDDTVRGAWFKALPRLHGLVVIINSSRSGMGADVGGLAGALLGHRVRQGGAPGRWLGVCLRRGRRENWATDKQSLSEGQRQRAADHREAAAWKRGGYPGRRGELQGSAAHHLCAVPGRNDLRGVRGWRGVHFAGAVPRSLK